jgi:hypothetical protein
MEKIIDGKEIKNILENYDIRGWLNRLDDITDMCNSLQGKEKEPKLNILLGYLSSIKFILK